MRIGSVGVINSRIISVTCCKAVQRGKASPIRVHGKHRATACAPATTGRPIQDVSGF